MKEARLTSPDSRIATADSVPTDTLMILRANDGWWIAKEGSREREEGREPGTERQRKR